MLTKVIFTEWKSNCSPVAVQPFVQTTGMAAQTTGEPGDFFSLFFTPEIVRELVQENNRYAAFCLQGKEASWSTDEQELRIYFGFYILMGLVRETEIRDYWSTNEMFHYAPIASRISRKRFEEITRYLHFVDKLSLPPCGHPGYHRLQLVKPVVDAMRASFSAVYKPGCQLSVDEAMIPFKGEVSKLY